MTYTLSQLLHDTYANLGDFSVHEASGGGVATLNDEDLYREYNDGDWEGGTLFILSAGGVAPEGEIVPIRQFRNVAGTDVAEFVTARNLSDVVEDGDSYALASKAYPLDTLIELVNTALHGLGKIALMDDSLTVTAIDGDPGILWSGGLPMSVEVRRGDGWQRVFDWEYIPAVGATAGKLLLNVGTRISEGARVWTVGEHPRMNAYSDTVVPTIAPALAAAAVLERALRWQSARQAGGDFAINARWEEAKRELFKARLNNPVWTPRRVGRIVRV